MQEETVQDDVMQALQVINALPPQQDRYIWCAIYTDGSYFREDDHLRKYSWANALAQNKTIKEVWLLLPDQSIDYGHCMRVPEGAEPIFFRRRYIKVNLLTGQETGEHATAHCIGYRQGDQGNYLFVFDNGSSLFTDNFQAI